MIASLTEGSHAARADALARAGGVLWRAGPEMVERSTDSGLTWTRAARLPASDEPADEAEDDPERAPVRQLAVLGDTVLMVGEAGLLALQSGQLSTLVRAPCRALAVGGTGRVAALCGRRLLTSGDGGASFQGQPAPPGARAIAWRGGDLVTAPTDGLAVTTRAGLVRCETRGLVDEQGRVRLREPCRCVRAEGAHVVAWGDDAAWLSTDGGIEFAPLPAAAAYDVIDMIPDGAEGAFALTDVGVVRLRPEPDWDEPEASLAGRLAPRVELSVQARQRAASQQLTVLALLTLPLDAPARPAASRARSAERTRTRAMRSRAVRLRQLARHVARSAHKLPDPKRRALRLLRAQELAAQASAVIEAVP